jgi:hypothetical protein
MSNKLKDPKTSQHKEESAIEYMRRIVHNLDYESENFLEDLKTIQALVDYFELWHVYDTDLYVGIIECIEEGDDPKPYNDFVAKYNLPWYRYEGNHVWSSEGEKYELRNGQFYEIEQVA